MTATLAPARKADRKRCSSCGAAIRWVRTERGKAMPLDAAPADEGAWQVIDGVAVHVGSSSLLFADEAERYRAHWATCPNADEHRRPR